MGQQTEERERVRDFVSEDEATEEKDPSNKMKPRREFDEEESAEYREKPVDIGKDQEKSQYEEKTRKQRPVFDIDDESRRPSKDQEPEEDFSNEERVHEFVEE